MQYKYPYEEGSRNFLAEENQAIYTLDRTCPLEKELNVYYIRFSKIYQFPYYLSIPFFQRAAVATPLEWQLQK